jgi:hypothetical protein
MAACNGCAGNFALSTFGLPSSQRQTKAIVAKTMIAQIANSSAVKLVIAPLTLVQATANETLCDRPR